MSYIRSNCAGIRSKCLGAILLTFFSIAAHAQCPTNGLAFIVNKGNATEGLSMAQLRRLLLGDLRNWPDKKKVSLITPNPQSAEFKCVLSAVVRMSDSEYHRFIASMGFRGEEPLDLYAADSDPAAAKMVSANPGGIGIVETGAIPAISASVRVLRINGKQPGEAGYPL
jgi:ABC-type phosphate transport system substrate-binding protein